MSQIYIQHELKDEDGVSIEAIPDEGAMHLVISYDLGLYTTSEIQVILLQSDVKKLAEKLNEWLNSKKKIPTTRAGLATD